MKASIPLVLLLALSAPTLASDGGLHPVSLEVTLADARLPAKDACVVQVVTPADGRAVLDAAAAQGCIDSWQAETTPGLGARVTCIDGVCEVPGTYWAYYLNGGYALGGVDNTNGKATIEEGDQVEFVYAQYVTCLGFLVTQDRDWCNPLP